MTPLSTWKAEYFNNYCAEKNAGSQRGVQLLQCITDYTGVFNSQSDGQEPVGFSLVPETVQVIREEFLQEMLRPGIELHKTNTVSSFFYHFLPNHTSVTLIPHIYDTFLLSVQERLSFHCLKTYSG